MFIEGGIVINSMVDKFKYLEFLKFWSMFPLN